MVRVHKFRRSTGRGERHSAAWGKRVSLVLALVIGIAFLANAASAKDHGRSNIARELSGFLSKAKQGSATGETVKVIVQYRETPKAEHYATMKGRGAVLHSKLHMIKGAAFTIPVSLLPVLENDSD